MLTGGPARAVAGCLLLVGALSTLWTHALWAVSYTHLTLPTSDLV